MGQQGNQLAERIRAFNKDLLSFVEHCSPDDWQRRCTSEDWTLGVVARHIGANHYQGAFDLARAIINGEKLPELTMEQVVEAANQHAREHADCTKSETIEFLNKSGEALAGFIEGLDDETLERSAHMSLMGKEVSAQKLVELVVLRSGGDHLASMKTCKLA